MGNKVTDSSSQSNLRDRIIEFAHAELPKMANDGKDRSRSRLSRLVALMEQKQPALYDEVAKASSRRAGRENKKWIEQSVREVLASEFERVVQSRQLSRSERYAPSWDAFQDAPEAVMV